MIVTRRIKPFRQERAFSLIELIVVISIIALLSAITIGVGASMADAGRQRATEGVLNVLDQTLINYIDSSGSLPPALVKIEPASLNEEVRDIVGDGKPAYYPVVDGRFDVAIPDTDPERHYEINTIGLYLKSIESGVDLDGLLSQIDNKFIKTHDLPDDLQPGMLTIFDAWGNPIRYVHPKFDGIIEDSTGPFDRRELGEPGEFLDILDSTDGGPGFFTAEHLPSDRSELPFDATGIRRNRILLIDQEEAKLDPGLDSPVETDSDGGSCPAQRPYFYSAGPDGDPATIEDNVYTTMPTFMNPL